jgi:acetyl-CoA carboxylase carboxyl transferase subunit alpha
LAGHLTFVDTPGATRHRREERGQGEAIARNLREMARLPVPVIVTVTGKAAPGERWQLPWATA